MVIPNNVISTDAKHECRDVSLTGKGGTEIYGRYDIEMARPTPEKCPYFRFVYLV